MKTLYPFFEDINLDLCGNQCLITINTQALKPKVNLFSPLLGHLKISKSGIERGLMLILKAIIKESLGADVDIKLIVMLFAGYLSLIKQPLYFFQIKAIKRSLIFSLTSKKLTYN